MDAALEASGSSPDVGLLQDVNRLSDDSPSWIDHTIRAAGEYGLLLALVPLLAGCWWVIRRRQDDESAAGSAAALLWAPLAAALAALVNLPIKDFVERPRPFVEHQGIHVVGEAAQGWSFVSYHATVAMAFAAALFVAHRRFGLAAIGIALTEGFCRVYVGASYPTDVVGGFALGTAVTLLLAPAASAVLTPAARLLLRFPRRRGLVGVDAGVHVGAETAGEDRLPVGGARQAQKERDLAA